MIDEMKWKKTLKLNDRKYERSKMLTYCINDL